MHNISITIAGITINTQSPLSTAELGIEKRLGPFLRPSVDPKESVSLRWEESLEEPLPHGELIYIRDLFGECTVQEETITLRLVILTMAPEEHKGYYEPMPHGTC